MGWTRNISSARNRYQSLGNHALRVVGQDGQGGEAAERQHECRAPDTRPVRIPQTHSTTRRSAPGTTAKKRPIHEGRRTEMVEVHVDYRRRLPKPSSVGRVSSFAGTTRSRCRELELERLWGGQFACRMGSNPTLSASSRLVRRLGQAIPDDFRADHTLPDSTDGNDQPGAGLAQGPSPARTSAAIPPYTGCTSVRTGTPAPAAD
jgi:hypothetical protein